MTNNKTSKAKAFVFDAGLTRNKITDLLEGPPTKLDQADVIAFTDSEHE